MLSQLNLRFHKKLIEALKVRAGRENTSVNALAERFLDNGLQMTAVGDGYFQLIADPEATARQLYRHIILGQTFGTSPLSREELRFILVHAREAFLRGQGRLATLPALGTLLDITHDLLAWQVEHDRPVDGDYLKGIFRLVGENWTEEFDAFRAELRPVVDQMYAEHLLRPLESDCFVLAEVPDAVLAEIFALPRLKAIFPLVQRGLDWTEEKATALAQELRPAVPAVTETIEAGTLRFGIRINGQPPGERPGGWYETPCLHLMITGQEFVVPYGWAVFSELLGLFTLYARHPEALAHGHQGERVMFSPPGHDTKEGFFGIDGLRIFLPTEGFESLVQELATKCQEEPLAEALNGLRCLYGDL
ncbi:transcriptional regulator [Salmonella enterica subsp. enterica]|uniref:Transcriptional regulator n=1 Tax=Salmonella newport TaxID=108619 RepID=A0A5Y0S3W3_SALNE|nr:transcriptional regulator [Salmonella enterica]EBS2908545.1 transcriptional regulator [Salmonella enterica subsp. enterica serovar Flottbek]EBS4086094.1 transcriptional regulator [Salmonella enterica subsp. enterica serovar Newport]ECC9721147.1 transcriptional regulator [Salmonella enterica subsp. diarizonae]EDP8833872.1 transcriptional regulator [Salmonella enterica subsp. enterica]EEE4104309.1 transcriptional regulator [Salmonella enterica subsp. enterica serovar Enteritidis]HCM6249621.1